MKKLKLALSLALIFSRATCVKGGWVGFGSFDPDSGSFNQPEGSFDRPEMSPPSSGNWWQNRSSGFNQEAMRGVKDPELSDPYSGADIVGEEDSYDYDSYETAEDAADETRGVGDQMSEGAEEAAESAQNSWWARW